MPTANVERMQRASGLLCLPPELRNRIYQYALSESDGLYGHSHESKPYLSHDKMPFREFNQLKYTCQQLYHETKGLELRYNDVTFNLNAHSEYETLVTDTFLAFIEKMPSRTLAELRIIRLIDDTSTPYVSDVDALCHFGGDISTTIRLLEFCTAFPQVTVYISVLGLKPVYSKIVIFFLNCMRLDAVFRKGGAVSQILPTCRDFQPMRDQIASNAAHEKEILNITGRNLDNLRLMPQGSFDADKFRSAVDSYMNSRRPSWFSNDELDLWVSYAERSYRDGI